MSPNSLNSLVQTVSSGILFKWGGWGDASAGLDCVGLADFVRRSLGVPEFDRDKVAWIYERYPTEQAAPTDLISCVASQLTEERLSPSHLDLILLKSRSGVICLSTYLSDGLPEPRLTFIHDRVVITPFYRIQSTIDIHSIVFPSGLIKNA